MSRSCLAVPAMLLLAACAPATSGAQATPQPQPEVRYLAVTTFNVPFGPDRQKVMMWLDSVFVEDARINANILSYRVATHNWGANSSDVVIIAEYPNWAAIEAECVPCEQRAEARQAPEGTPEREKWDDISATFARYYSGHRDEIYAVPLSRTKQ